MKAVTLLVNSLLPPELQDPNRQFDKRGLDLLFADLARTHPERYRAISKRVMDVGREAAWLQGETITLNDLRPVFDKNKEFEKMDAELAVAKRQSKTPEEYTARRSAIWANYSDSLEKMTTDAALASGNNLGSTVVSGARGSPGQLKAMLTSPVLYTDYKENVIPVFVRNSFGEGLRPYEYLPSTFGVRKSVISTKNSTAKGGDLLKQMVQAAASQVVTEEDCGTDNGLDYEADEKDARFRFLSRPYAGIPAGTPIDKEVQAVLRKKGVKSIIARSPMTCQSRQGICSKCLGLLPNGKEAPLGYAAGITAAQGIGEPIVQGALNAKHSGGALGSKKKTFAGFPVIDQLVQSPETFADRAAVSEIDGIVTKIEDAPQGGKFVYVGEQSHYALPDYEITVKPGDKVEAGDQLSDGIIDVSDIVRLRGIGEARIYYRDRLRQALEESGAGKASKLNLEVMARAALNHVRVTDLDGIGEYLPDDVVSYNSMISGYSPPATSRLASAKDGVGKYLHSPALHFSIGTKLTPKMTDRLQSAGISQIIVDDNPPKFEPEMTRLRSAAHNSPDWLAKMHTSYLTSNLGNSAARAQDTNVEANPHFAPRLAIGKDFGKDVEKTGLF